EVDATKTDAFGLHELLGLGGVPRRERPRLPAGNRDSASRDVSLVLGQVLDAEGLVRPRRYLHALVGLDLPGEIHQNALRPIPVAQHRVVVHAPLADFHRPLELGWRIELPLDRAILEDPRHAQLRGELDLPGGAGREDVAVSAALDQIVGAVAEKPPRAQLVARALRYGLQGASGHGDGQTREDGRESQRSGSSSHSAHLRRRRRSTLARQHEHHVFPLFGGRVRVYLTAPESEKTSPLETSSARAERRAPLPLLRAVAAGTGSLRGHSYRGA